MIRRTRTRSNPGCPATLSVPTLPPPPVDVRRRTLRSRPRQPARALATSGPAARSRRSRVPGEGGPAEGGRGGHVPAHRALEPILERRPRPEAEGALGARHVEAAARLSIRLRGVPDDPTAEARERDDSLGQIADRDLEPRPDIHGLRPVVALARERDRLGSVLDEQELARGLARSPDNHLVQTGLARLDALADQGRDDMRRTRIEVVAGAIEVHRQEKDGVESVLLAVGLRLD